jgi:DNA-binding CsgD family transcriptional regulator
MRCQTGAVGAPSGLVHGLVDRAGELAVIDGLLDVAAIGEAQTVVVSGDAGVGKTALVAGACLARSGTSTVLTGACLPLTSMSIPFLPIRSALRGVPAELGDLPDLAAVEGEFVLAFDAWLDRRSAERPVVLVIDDLQWADRSTLDAIMYVIAGPATRRLAVVATLRSGEVGPGHPLLRWLADVGRLPRTTELSLGPLDRTGTAALLQILLGGSPHQSLIDDVHAHARGNPYFTRLMVAGLSAEARTAPAYPSDLRSAVLQSWFHLPPETRRLATVLAVGGRPMRVEDVAEIVGEDPDPVRVRMQAALDSGTVVAVGEGAFWFHHPLSAEVLEAELAEWDRRDLHSRFADVLQRRFATVAQTGAPETATDAVAIADHRDAANQAREAYEWALTAADLVGGAGGRAEQLRLLRRAVMLRAELTDAEESVDELLRRLRGVAAAAGASADELDAVESLLTRVDRKTQPLVVSELLVRRMHLRDLTGQAFIDVDEMREAVRLAEADPTSSEYALALAELAHAEVWAGHSEASDHAGHAMAIARATQDLRALSHALAAGSMTAGIADDVQEAQLLAREAVEAARSAGDWWAYVHAMMWEADADRTWGSAAYSVLVKDRRVEMSERGGPRAYSAWMSAVEAQNWLMIGEWRECDGCLRVVLGSDPGPLGDVMARLVAARAAALRGHQAEAESHLLRVEELMVDGSTYTGLEYDAVHTEVRLGAHDHVGALRAAMNGAEKSGAPPTRCEWLLPLAARALADRLQSAHDTGRSDGEGLEMLDALVSRFPQVIRDIGPTTGVRGRLLAAFDAQYAAEQARARRHEGEAAAWIRAVDAFADAHLPWEEAYSRWRAAEALLGRGRDRRSGADMLRRGLALARRLTARPVETELLDLAARARIAVAEPSAAASDAAAAAHGLTERERDVLDLIAVGRTYSEIARTLMISQKTVSTHVSHLLAKTGSANRVELARLVPRVDPGRDSGP